MNWKSKREEKRRLEKLYEEIRNRYPGPYRDDRRGGIIKKGYPYSTNHKNVKKWFRRMANRKFRRNKNDSEEVLSRNQHKKNFDLWWTLY